MELRKEVVERLLLTKSLLAKMRFHSTAAPDSKFLASQIMTAHDAAELVLAAISDQRSARSVAFEGQALPNGLL